MKRIGANACVAFARKNNIAVAAFILSPTGQISGLSPQPQISAR